MKGPLVYAAHALDHVITTHAGMDPIFRTHKGAQTLILSARRIECLASRAENSHIWVNARAVPT